MSERIPVRGVDRDDLTLPEPTADTFRWWLLHHLQFTVGKDPDNASKTDWRLALTHTIRDRAVTPWFESTRRTWTDDRKRVHYLSMEFLIGRLLEDATINLGLRDVAEEALDQLGLSFAELTDDEPDAALGNGGLGRLAACYMESMATLGCPGFGYGLRYEHGLFKQSFDHGRQIETPEDWLATPNPWDFVRPESAYDVGFGGHVEDGGDGHRVWHPRARVQAAAHDTPVIGYGGNWANTLRLWAALPTADLFDLDRFNAGEFVAASNHEAMARALSKVLYPNDSTEGGKELRLSQEFFLTSASVQDILRRYLTSHSDLSRLPEFVAIQMNDTHPAIAGPELIRLLVDEHGFDFDSAADITTQVLGYTNHTLLPEALERWSIGLMGKTLPRHLEIIERLDHREIELCGPRPYGVGLIGDGHVKMGELAFVTSHKVNGVSALHSDLVKRDLFPVMDRRHPGRILTAHDGFTLTDVVSYNDRHNEANGEHGNDGHGENFSDNLGAEGPTDDPGVVEARARRVRGMLATLLLSQGTTMLLAGDELGNGQGGNNNAYVQDNPTGWVDWSGVHGDLLAFTRELIALRRRLPVLRQSAYRHGRLPADGHRDVEWFRVDGTPMTVTDWHATDGRPVGVILRGTAGDTDGEANCGAVALVVNTGCGAEVSLPSGGSGGEGGSAEEGVGGPVGSDDNSRTWTLELDSARPGVLNESRKRPDRVVQDAETTPSGRTGDSTGEGTWDGTGPYPVLGQSVVVFSAG